MLQIRKNKVLQILVFTMVLAVAVGMVSFLVQSPNAYAGSLPEWQPDKAYWGGDEVEYQGKVYVAKWWTQGDIPNKPVDYPWETPWQLKSGSTPQPTGQPTPQPTPQPSTPPSNANVIYPDYSSVDVGQGMPWPETVFAPFVDATGWPPLELAAKTKELRVPYYNLGFIVSQSRDICKPTWGTYYSAEAGPLNDEIKKLRAMGGDVIVSFGGAANVPLHVAAPDAETLKEQYKRFVLAYGLTRIDFDIEGAWVSDTASLVKNSKALKMLQDELKAENYPLQVWFTLPVLPSGLTPDGINVINIALDEHVEIDGVNVMTMDYGASAAPNPNNQMGEYGIQAIESLKVQLAQQYSTHGVTKSDDELWSMIGTTPMIGMNDVTTEIFDQQEARETLAFAEQNNIGMISMWSMNRDKSPNGELGYVSISESSIVQEDYEFSRIFNTYNDTSILDISAGGEDENPGGEIPITGTWSASKIYHGGDRVTYNGLTYEAKWWTQGDAPDQEVNYFWETPWKLIQ